MKAKDATTQEEIKEMNEEIDVLYQENQSLFEKLEYTCRDLDVVETKYAELQQEYEQELFASSQVYSI